MISDLVFVFILLPVVNHCYSLVRHSWPVRILGHSRVYLILDNLAGDKHRITGHQEFHQIVPGPKPSRTKVSGSKILRHQKTRHQDFPVPEFTGATTSRWVSSRVSSNALIQNLHMRWRARHPPHSSGTAIFWNQNRSAPIPSGTKISRHTNIPAPESAGTRISRHLNFLR